MNNLYILVFLFERFCFIYELMTFPSQDSRPKANAVANRARGGGYEDVSNYPNTFLSFENMFDFFFYN